MIIISIRRCNSFWQKPHCRKGKYGVLQIESKQSLLKAIGYICNYLIGSFNMIYLDHNATTPVDEEVLDEMLPYFKTHFGNASSRSHPLGWIAEEAVKIARERVAEGLQIAPNEIVFTSGATESVNLAMKGVWEMYRSKGNHIVTFMTEHKAVLDTCAALEKKGASVTYLPVDHQGLPDLEELEKAIRPETILVAAMWANNETGVIFPIKAIGELCEEKQVLFFSDATQAVGKIKVHPRLLKVHLLAFSGHKIYGPKGVGGLYVSGRHPRVRLASMLDGGGHERGFRSGTLNVPGIVGLGKAFEVAMRRMPEDTRDWISWRDWLEHALLENVPYSFVNGAGTDRLPNVANIGFKHVESERLMMTFNQKIALSSGSACTSASLEPSHVLSAMGLTEDEAHGSLRYSFGRSNQQYELEEVVALTVAGVAKLRNDSLVWKLFLERKS